MAKSTFREKITPTENKGSGTFLHLLEQKQRELEKLIEDKQIISLEKCSDEHFNSPVLTTIEIRSFKITSESKELNDAQKQISNAKH